MSMVAEPLISILVEKALSNITSLLESKIKIRRRKRKNFFAEINRWKTTLEDLEGVLRDADNKKQSNPEVRNWLEDLEELTYDIEDALEEFNYHVLQRQVEASEPSRFPKRWKDNLLRIRRTGQIWENSDKLNEITKRFQRLKDRKGDLNLFILPALSSTMLQPSRCTRVASSHFSTEPVIYGRDDDKLEIIHILKEEGDAIVGVVSILGMGGLGKTTLARYVYHDEEIKSHFDVRVWVCVSADFDIPRITKDILEFVYGNCGDIKDKALPWIQTKLGDVLKNKKFLLVLDDVWNDNYTDWTTLTAPLKEGLKGSKIIVTTRKQNVARRVSTVPFITPNFLSEDDCWSLLCAHAKLDPKGTSIFQEVGKKIARKCSGLPLAAMTVGGVLRDKLRVEEWEHIQKSMVWASEDVFPVLRMSYNDLTGQLKRCFAFFSLFPEDYGFREDEVVFLWIGIGLIPSGDGEKSKEEVARDCFHKLLARSLFSACERENHEYNLSSTKSEEYYMMHDLVRELAQQVSPRNLYKDNLDKEIIKSIRYLSFKDSICSSIVESIIEGGKVTALPLRAVLLWSSYWWYLPRTDVNKMFSRLKYIRALSLERLSFEIGELEVFGEMKLLSYLNLSGSRFWKLPKSLTTLYNLEILILRGCSNLEQLPDDIYKLIRLWYLDIIDCLRLDKLPERIKELKSLEKVTRFEVDEKVSMAASLGNLKCYPRSLEIACLNNVASPEEAKLARLSEKRLNELVLDWSGSQSGDPPLMETQSQILEQLQPHENLKALKIKRYNGQMFPYWLKGCSLRCLSVLEIDNCRNCNESFSPNALMSLKELRISNCAKLEVHLERMPKLKKLSLSRCSYVRCTDTFNTAALDALTLDRLAMSDLFKEKVRLGVPYARYLSVGTRRNFAPWDVRNLSLWEVPDLSMIADNYDEEMKVEVLYVDALSSIEHLPQWVCKAKSLEVIRVYDCPSLKELLPGRDIPSSLKKIQISNCPRLAILSQDTLPETAKPLESIDVSNCPSLKVLLPAKDTCVYDCISLESFYEGGLLPRSIEKLRIWACPLLSKKLRDGDEQLCSMISLQASITVDGEEIDLNQPLKKKEKNRMIRWTGSTLTTWGCCNTNR